MVIALVSDAIEPHKSSRIAPPAKEQARGTKNAGPRRKGIYANGTQEKDHRKLSNFESSNPLPARNHAKHDARSIDEEQDDRQCQNRSRSQLPVIGSRALRTGVDIHENGESKVGDCGHQEPEPQPASTTRAHF